MWIEVFLWIPARTTCIQTDANNCRQVGNHKVVTRFSSDGFFCFVLFFSALAMGLCVSMIAYIRLPSLKVSTLLLIGLLIYDVFWVSFGQIQLYFYQSFSTAIIKLLKDCPCLPFQTSDYWCLVLVNKYKP